MIIGCDIDGVLADLQTTWLFLYNRDFKDTLKPSDIKDWDISKFVKPDCGKKIFKYLSLPRLYDAVTPIRGSQLGIKALQKFGRVVFITSEIEGAGGRKFTWLKRHGFVPDIKDYIEASDKSLIPTDVMIDDKLENLVSARVKILYNQPYNQSADSRLYNFRLHNWFTLIKALAK